MSCKQTNKHLYRPKKVSFIFARGAAVVILCQNDLVLIDNDDNNYLPQLYFSHHFVSKILFKAAVFNGTFTTMKEFYLRFPFIHGLPKPQSKFTVMFKYRLQYILN